MIEISIADVIAASRRNRPILDTSLLRQRRTNLMTMMRNMKFGSWCTNLVEKNNDNVLAHFVVTGFLTHYRN